MHWLLLFVALVPGWLATRFLKQLRFVQKLRNVGVQAEATVISQRLVPVGRGNSQLLPRVAYHLASGAEIVGESQEYNFKTEFFDGDIAVIVYDPDRPADFLFYQELDLQSRYLAFAGACFAVLGVVWSVISSS